jgi:hypothetical protein
MTDLVTLKGDPVLFSQRVLNIDPWEHQRGPLTARQRNVTIAGGRRSGKSQTAQIKSIHVAGTRRNVQVLVVAPVIDNSRAWLREASDILRASKLKGSVVDIEAQSIKFTTGSEILCLPATDSQIRGYGRRLHLIVCEEAGFQDANIVRALSYTLLDNYAEGAQLWQVGSPWGPPDHPFRVYYERGLESGNDEDYASFTVRTLDNPNLDSAFIERERRRLSASEAAAELDGVWSEAVGSLFSKALLESVTAPFAVPALNKLQPPASGIMGCDWGVSYDMTSFVFLYRLPIAELNPYAEPVPRFICLPYVWPAGTSNRDISIEVVNSGTQPAWIAPETNGAGSFPSEELFRRFQKRPAWKRHFHYVNTTAMTKTAGYSCLLSLMENGQIILPNHVDLLRQLAGLRYEQGARGFMKIENEQAAMHDDISDALYLTSLPYSAGRGKTACGLIQLATAPRAPIDSRCPPLDCETVETGDGLILYQKPPLQSVRDFSVSMFTKPILAGIRENRGFYDVIR